MYLTTAESKVPYQNTLFCINEGKLSVLEACRRPPAGGRSPKKQRRAEGNERGGALSEGTCRNKSMGRNKEGTHRERLIVWFC